MAVAAPILSVALATTLAAGVAAFLTAIAPLLTLTGLIPLAATTAAIGYFYAQRLRWSGVLWREWLVLLAPFIVLWRIVTLFTLGRPIVATLGSWLAHPVDIFDGSFVLGAAVLTLAWTQGVGYGRDLAALHPPDLAPAARPGPDSPLYWTADETRRASYVPPPTALLTRWLQGGLLLVILSALGAAGVRQIMNGPALLRLVTFAAPDESVPLPNTLLYMLCGLMLAGLAQLGRLRANWTIDGVVVAPRLARSALRALGVLIVVSLGVALVLPTRYALGLGDLLGIVIDVLAAGAAAIYALIALLLSPLAALFGHDSAPPRRPTVPRPPPPLSHAPHGGGDVLGSLLFWLVALAVVGYCAYALSRHAKGRVPALSVVSRLMTRALALCGRLARLIVGVVRRGAAGVALVVRQLTPLGRARANGHSNRMRHTPLRRLGPRERVAYLYLSIEERARRLGLPRRTGQTASEYSHQLRREAPDLDPDLAGLTDLFLEARYSPHPFEEARAAGARTLWQRVRARLRGRRAIK